MTCLREGYRSVRDASAPRRHHGSPARLARSLSLWGVPAHDARCSTRRLPPRPAPLALAGASAQPEGRSDLQLRSPRAHQAERSRGPAAAAAAARAAARAAAAISDGVTHRHAARTQGAPLHCCHRCCCHRCRCAPGPTPRLTRTPPPTRTRTSHDTHTCARLPRHLLSPHLTSPQRHASLGQNSCESKRLHCVGNAVVGACRAASVGRTSKPRSCSPPAPDGGGGAQSHPATPSHQRSQPRLGAGGGGGSGGGGGGGGCGRFGADSSRSEQSPRSEQQSLRWRSARLAAMHAVSAMRASACSQRTTTAAEDRTAAASAAS